MKRKPVALLHEVVAPQPPLLLQSRVLTTPFRQSQHCNLGGVLILLWIVFCSANMPELRSGDVAFSVVAHYPMERATDVAVSGDYVYLTGSGLRVFDRSVPTNPRLVWSELPGDTQGVVVSADVAYVVGSWGEETERWSGLQVLGVTKPTNPQLLGQCRAQHGVWWALTVSGPYAYVVGADTGLQILDLRHPRQPQCVGAILEGTTTWDVAVGAGHAYVTDSTAALWVFDVSDPRNPHAVSRLPGEWGSNAGGLVALSGQYCYVASASGLKVIQVADPYNLEVVGACAPSAFENAIHMTVVGDYVLAPTGQSSSQPAVGRLSVIDVSNPTMPTEVAAHETTCSAAIVSGEHVYLAGNDGLTVLQADFLASAPLIYRQPQGGHAVRGESLTLRVATDPGMVSSYIWHKDGNPFTEDGRISAVDGPTLHIRDVENSDAGDYTVRVSRGAQAGISQPATIEVLEPLALSVVGQVGVEHSRVLAVGADYVWLEGRNSLVIVDVADPKNPRIVGHWVTTHTVEDLAVQGSYACVATHDSGLVVIDASNPANPHPIGTCDTGPAYAVEVSGHYAFVTGEPFRLSVIDVSDPAALRRVGSCDLDDGLTLYLYKMRLAVDRVREYAYLASSRGFLVIDISEPTNPTLASAYETGYDGLNVATYDVVMSDGVAYVLMIHEPMGFGSLHGVQVVDISQPQAPTLLREYFREGMIGDWAMAVSGTRAYEAHRFRDGRDCLHVIDISHPRGWQHVGALDGVENGISGIAGSGDYIYMTDERSLKVIEMRPLLRLPPSSCAAQPDGRFTFRASSAPRQRLEIQRSDDLTTWTIVDTVTNDAGHADLVDIVQGQNRAFFRIHLKE